MGSSYAIFAAGVVFAGPLLRFSGVTEGAIFALSGETSTGKTGVCLFAQAIMGDPDPAKIPSWDATEAGIKEMLAAMQGFTLVVDDTSRHGGTGGEQSTYWNDLSYAIAGGGKRRVARAYEVQHGSGRDRPAAFVLTSSELTPTQIAKLGGATVKGGASVRYIDNPVPPQDRGGALDNGVRSVPPDRVVEVGRAGMTELERAIKETHGVSFPVYLDYLEENFDDLSKRVQDIEEDFTRKVGQIVPGEASSADLRIARKFGLVLAGLTLAREACAIPFLQEDMEEAVKVCFTAAMGHLARAAEVQRDRMKELRDVVRDRDKLPLLAKGETPGARTFGFRREKLGAERAYMTAEQIGRALSIPANEVAGLVCALVDRGRIVPDAGGDKTRQVKVGGKRVRFHEFSASFSNRKTMRAKV